MSSSQDLNQQASQPAGQGPLTLALLRLGAYGLGALAMWALVIYSGLPDAPASGLMSLVGRPQGWRRLVWFYFPLGLLLLSLAGDLLLARCPGARPRRLADLAIDLALLAGLAALVLLHSRLHSWPLWLGFFYLAALVGKTAAPAIALWRLAGAQDQQTGPWSATDRFLARGLGVLAAGFFLALAFWTVQAVSTCGDEQRYLFNVDRFLASLGLSPGQGQWAELRSQFYWGRWSRVFTTQLADSPAFFLLLAPGVLLAGRLGALAVLSLAGGAAAGMFYYAARRLDYSRRDCLLATGLLASCLPFLQLSQTVYPGILGVGLTTAGLALLLGPERLAWRRVALLALVMAALVLVKDRFIPVAAGLGLSLGLAWLASSRLPRGLVLGLFFGPVLAGFLALALAESELLPVEGTPFARLLPSLRAPEIGLLAKSIPALFLDQEFGLFFYAPWLALGLAALPLFWREHARQAPLILMVALATLGPVVIWRWMQWDGGFTPPTRFLAPMLPCLALWTLPMWARVRGRLARFVLVNLVGLGLAMSFILSLMPQWRYHRRLGANNLLMQMEEMFDTVLHRFFPSFTNIYWPEMLPAVLGIALILLAGVYLWRRRDQAASGPAPGAGWWGNLWPLSGGLALLVLLVILGRHLPTSHLQAEAMRRGQGTAIYGAMFTAPVLLVLQRPAGPSWLRLVWGPGNREIVLRARSFKVVRRDCNFRERLVKGPPEIQVAVDGQPLGRLRVGYQWRDYGLPANLTPGVHRLSVQYISQPGCDAVALDYFHLL